MECNANVSRVLSFQLLSFRKRITAMVLHNPNNWHWVTKDVTAWTKKWLEDNLNEISAKNGDVEVKIVEVESIEGEAEVYQRKGKVKTVFDLELALRFAGKDT